MALIEIENVSKIYKTGEIEVFALKQLSLSIELGAFAVLAGPSGSGKTTVLNLVGCLDTPTQGKVVIDGKQTNHSNRKQQAAFRGAYFGFIFQSFNLFSVLTAYENVEYPLIMVKNTPEAKRRKMVLKVLEAVGMTDHKEKYPDQLSGGQKQRVAIARALVTEPKLVLADEPTANLDRKSAANVIHLMRMLKDEFKTTFVFSTHDKNVMDEAEIIFTLEDGRLIESAPII